MSRGRCATEELRFHLVNASVVIKDLIVKAKAKPRLFPMAFSPNLPSGSQRRTARVRRWEPDGKLGENDVGFPTVIYTETGKLV